MYEKYFELIEPNKYWLLNVNVRSSMTSKMWKNKPMSLEYFDTEVDYILFIDETGIPSLKNYNQNNKWFSMTGILIGKDEGGNAIEKMMTLKQKYWENALFNNKRVIFHSREYRKKLGAFNPKIVDYESLREELLATISDLEFTIFSSGINKDFLVGKYNKPYAVYWYSLVFLIERYSIFLNNCNKTGVIVLESRGKKEDKNLLREAIFTIENGTNFVESKVCSLVRGIYFNCKRTMDAKKSYPYLELADLIGYEIHNRICRGLESDFYKLIENKIYNYPNILGYGLKIFDKKD